MNIVEAFLILVDAAENVHRSGSIRRRMPVPSLDLSLDIGKPEPPITFEVEYIQIIESDVSVPATKDIHVIIVHHRGVAEAQLRLRQEHEALPDSAR